MRVLLAGPDQEENLSIRYLSAALLHAGHEAILGAFNSPADILPVADAAVDADIVGLSMCFQSRAQEFLRLARLIKARHPERLIIAGGHYASCAAEPLLAHHPELDVIVIHEGEGTLVEIAEAVPRLQERLPQIGGIAYREGAQVRFTAPRRTIDDLDALPLPDRRGPIHVIAGVPTSYLMGSRGCYGSCAYCCITTLHRMAPGRRFRQRKVERIADEMAALYDERGTRQFVFHDDNFLVPADAWNHARLAAFGKALKSRGIRDIALVIKCRPADAQRSVLERLKDLGLVRVFLGVESATARGLADLERRQTVGDSERALETCAALDISAQFTLMTFHPDSTLETLRADVAFLRRFCGNPLNFCRTEIYPGTPLEQRMIALGRTRGDYLARVYSLSDPVADLACKLSLELFESRCWGDGSLMQCAIGLDHTSAVAKRFHGRSVVCERVNRWLRSANLDTIELLAEVIEQSASRQGRINGSLQRAILPLREREVATRRRLLAEAIQLKTELEALRFPSTAREVSHVPGPRLRLARQVAAAVLAIGMPATAGSQALAQEVKTPPPASSSAQENLCSLSGTVKDVTGAVVANATVTITNIDTGQVRTQKTNTTGEYAANDLRPGRYTVKVESPGFKVTEKTGLVLKAGERQRVDLVLSIGDFGCCEYVAVPLKTHEDWLEKPKPFTYTVGETENDNTLQAIAKLVYGDPNAWLPIFEANRNVLSKPGPVPYATPLVIPARTRSIPKVISRVAPVYPAAAAKEHAAGDVVLDIALKDDGTMDSVVVMDGPPLLAEAATDAVKQWRYQPVAKNKSAKRKFVVVVSFGKGGKVHYR